MRESYNGARDPASVVARKVGGLGVSIQGDEDEVRATHVSGSIGNPTSGVMNSILLLECHTHPLTQVVLMTS